MKYDPVSSKSWILFIGIKPITGAFQTKLTTYISDKNKMIKILSLSSCWQATLWNLSIYK